MECAFLKTSVEHSSIKSTVLIWLTFSIYIKGIKVWAGLVNWNRFFCIIVPNRIMSHPCAKSSGSTEDWALVHLLLFNDMFNHFGPLFTFHFGLLLFWSCKLWNHFKTHENHRAKWRKISRKYKKINTCNFYIFSIYQLPSNWHFPLMLFLSFLHPA